MLENEVIELQMALEKEQKSGSDARSQLLQLKTEHKELADEYIVLKTNHIQLSADHQQEVLTKTIYTGFDFSPSWLERVQQEKSPPPPGLPFVIVACKRSSG